MADQNHTPHRGLGDLFEDLWGTSVRPSAEKKTSKKGPSTEELLDSINALNTNLRKSLASDFSDPEPAPSNKTQEKLSSVSSNPTQTSTAAETPAAAPQEPETDPMEDLNALVGLTDLKKDVEELISLAKMQKMRREQGLKSIPVSLHLVFSGNPGTGKTTVARILARLYKQIGVLSKGQLVEVDRSALVAGFVGQTAVKTQEKIKEAMGGILFIDEAYTLAKSAGNDFGQEAIDTLLKAMEDHREDFVVIVAGYPDLMQKFINSNPGLKSRFNKYLYFKDYTAEELQTIFDGFLKKYDYHLADDAKEAVKEAITEMEAKKDANFANAREVRNLFEKIITRQALRIDSLPETEEKPEITEILTEDVTGKKPEPENMSTEPHTDDSSEPDKETV